VPDGTIPVRCSGSRERLARPPSTSGNPRHVD
jgi:hypothetical protein